MKKTMQDIYTPVEWKCASGHKFKMSVNAKFFMAATGVGMYEEFLGISEDGERESILRTGMESIVNSPEEDYEIPMQFSAYDIEEELKEKLGFNSKYICMIKKR